MHAQAECCPVSANDGDIGASPTGYLEPGHAAFRQGDERPMAGNPQAMEQLRRLLNTREGLYARAEAQLDTEGRSVAQSREDLLGLISANGYLG